MGREVRMVPKNWEHPKKTEYNFLKQRDVTNYQPMYDQSYVDAATEYRDGFLKFYNTNEHRERACEFWDWHGNPPNEAYYRAYQDKEASWYQLYETVSEGTPVSPPYKTKEELADYLAEHGDFWDQKRRKEGETIMNCEPWGKEQAYKFVMGDGWAPSMVITDGKMQSGVEFVTSND